MLYIYSTLNGNKQNGKYIYDVEAIYKLQLKSIIKEDYFDTVVKNIDGAEHIGDGSLDGKFGLCNANDISTGSKALLLALYNKAIVNFSSAGSNVLELCIQMAENRDMHIFLPSRIPMRKIKNTVKFDGAEMNINQVMEVI